MSSLRQLGNEQFKKNNFQKAIQCYDRYIEQEHNDNYIAYTNMSMCYYRLKDYSKAIQACQNALLCNKQHVKAYYRLYLTYKEIPNQEYGVFINAYLFLKYFKDENQAAKSEALSIMRQFKPKFINKKIYPQIKCEEDVLRDLSTLNEENSSIDEEPGSMFEWEEYLSSSQISVEQKVVKIEDIAVAQYGFAINLAYMLLNSCESQENKNYVKQKISSLKKQLKLQQQLQKQVVPVQQQSRVNESSQENLFQSQSQKPEVKNQQKVENHYDQQDKIQQSQELQIESRKIIQEKSQLEINTNEEKVENEVNEQINVQKEGEAKVEEQFPQQAQLNMSPAQIDDQINAFLERSMKARDIFIEIKQTVIKVLSSNQTVESKQSFLLKLSKRCSQIKLIKSCLPQKDKENIYALLVKNKLEKLSQIYAPKAK